MFVVVFVVVGKLGTILETSVTSLVVADLVTMESMLETAVATLVVADVGSDGTSYCTAETK